MYGKNVAEHMGTTFSPTENNRPVVSFHRLPPHCCRSKPSGAAVRSPVKKLPTCSSALGLCARLALREKKNVGEQMFGSQKCALEQAQHGHRSLSLSWALSPALHIAAATAGKAPEKAVVIARACCLVLRIWSASQRAREWKIAPRERESKRAGKK